MIRCLIVDDEPAARDVLKAYIAEVDWLTLKAEVSNALQAHQVLQNEAIDLIFLDINMPKMDGLSFLEKMRPHAKIIMTTAYAEHALKGFELSVVDYLLKPFSFERFFMAVSKMPRESASRRLSFKSDKRIYLLEQNDLVFIEAMGDYLQVHLADKKIVVHETMKEVQQKLDENLFIRIHRSYIIHRSKIDFIEGNLIAISGQKLPIGETYRLEVKRLLGA